MTAHSAPSTTRTAPVASTDVSSKRTRGPSALTTRLHRGWQWGKPHLPVVALALIGAAAAVIMNLVFFPHYSDNADEAVYMQQAQALQQGHLTFTYPEVKPAGMDNPVGFTQPWLTGAHNGAYFTKYLPGFPALITASLMLFGTPLGGLALAAAMWVLGVYTLTFVAFGSRRLALGAAALLIVSPIFLIQSAVYLSYAASSGLMCAGVAAVLHGARFSNRRWLIFGGFIWGVWLLFRQYDVMLAVSVTMLFVLWHWGRHWRKALRLLIPIGVGALPGFVSLLAFNWRVTGSPLLLPLAATDPLDSFGFGTHRIMPGEPTVQYHFSDAWQALTTALLATPGWLVGGLAIVVFVAIGFLAGRRHRPARLLLFGLAAVFPLGYFPFWGMLISKSLFLKTHGPFYYIPMLTVLVIVAARGVTVSAVWLKGFVRKRHNWVGRLASRAWVWRVGTAVAVAAAVAVSVINLGEPLRLQRQVTHRATTLLNGVPSYDTLRQPAVILLIPTERYVGVPYQSLANPYLGDEGYPDNLTDHQVIFAATRGSEAVRITQALPGRTPYGYFLPSLDPDPTTPVPAGSFVPLSVVESSRVRLATTITVPADENCHVAFFILAGERHTRSLGCRLPTQQTFTFSWEIEATALAKHWGVKKRVGASGILITGTASNSKTPPPNVANHSRRSLAWWGSSQMFELRSSTLVIPKTKDSAAQIRMLTPAVPWLATPLPTGQKWDIRMDRKEVQTTVTGVG